MQRTLVLVKPDAMARRLVGEIVSRLERKGLKLVGCKLTHLAEDDLRVHYSHLASKAFYPRIAAFMRSLPVLAQCWEGLDAVTTVRRVVGETNGRLAAPGTLRGDFSISVQCNLVHASDSPESAVSEVQRFFSAAELFDYQLPLLEYTYSADEITGN